MVLKEGEINVVLVVVPACRLLLVKYICELSLLWKTIPARPTQNGIEYASALRVQAAFAGVPPTEVFPVVHPAGAPLKFSDKIIVEGWFPAVAESEVGEPWQTDDGLAVGLSPPESAGFMVTVAVVVVEHPADVALIVNSTGVDTAFVLVIVPSMVNGPTPDPLKGTDPLIPEGVVLDHEIVVAGILLGFVRTSWLISAPVHFV